MEQETAPTPPVDITSTYDSELIISSLTMSDLDELRRYVVDDMILELTSG